ncbi:MAG: sensor histidine kinase [Steroidobacteraceae bacterium]
MRQALRSGAESFYLPDFCASRAALAIVLIVELTAVVLALARQGANQSGDFWGDLARTSLFLLWVGLVCAALLCSTRKRLERLTVARGSLAVLTLLLAAIAAISAAAYFIGRSEFGVGAGTAAFFPITAWPFVLRNMAIGFVIIAVALRYFYVTHQWRRNIEMRATARVHALQARIRPHFLFNSMNTIASLTRSDAVLAEQAVQDLADLFRASLSDQYQTITLQEELEVARTYQRIEELRLGPRLQVSWDVDRLPPDARVPGLVLQPLLENAIYHGIEPRPEGGTVSIVGELAGELITIVVRNPVARRESEREGHRLALGNIRERLALLYGELALVKAGRFDEEYIVTLRFPHVSAREKA